MEYNKYQSTPEQLNLDSYPEEIKEQFFDFVNTVPYIKNLISINRPYAKDCPRDSLGKIIIDFTNPPIIEDTDYFRPTAIHFLKYGCVTKLRPNLNPNSEYGKWVREETRRCFYGYVRESDGAWVTGDMYFFLNYCPIMKVKRVSGKKGIRVVDFPDFLEGQWLKFMYTQYARDNAKHGAELAKRGAGKSFCMASILAKRFILGEYDDTTGNITKRVESFVASYLKNYLNEDGILNKFESYIDFCAEFTQFPRKRLLSSINNMHWLMGFKEVNSEAKKGSLNEVIGISVKDSAGKLRGKRGAFIGLEEFGCHIKGTEVLMYDTSIKKVEDIQVGDLLMGDDGTPRKVLEAHNGIDLLYKITLSNGDWHIVNSNHPLYYKKHNWSSNTDSYVISKPTELIGKDLLGCYIPKAVILFPYKEVKIHPYLLGLWLGDGDSTRLSIANEDIEVLNWLKTNYVGYLRDLPLSKTCKVFHFPSKDNKDLYSYFREYNLFNNKYIPNDYIYNTQEIGLQLLAGLIDTDGNLNIQNHGLTFEITLHESRKHILDAAKFIATNCGFRCTMNKKTSKGKKVGIHYRLRISGDIYKIPTKVLRKQAKLISTKYKQRRCWTDYTFKVEPYNVGEYFGFTVTDNHLFVLKDSTITHNSFPNLIELYSTLRPSMEDGDIVFGMIYAQGCVCAGTKVVNSKGEICNVEDIQLGDKLLGYNGTNCSVEDVTYIQEPAYKECVRITTSKNNILECSTDHPLLVFKDACCSFYLANELQIGDNLMCINTESYTGYTYSDVPFKLRENNKGEYFKDKVLNNIHSEEIKSIEFIGKQRVYNLTANTTHTYLTNGFISSNTAGDKDSDFSAALKIMYSPRAFNMLPILNVYDKVGLGKSEFVYFYPAYINRNGCYNEDGISDVTKAILEVLINRYNVKYNTTDSTLITKTIAEHPIVPQEAVLRTKGNLFPSALINERLNQIDANPNIFDDVYIGELIFEKSGLVKYVPSNDVPIRTYPTEDNKDRGAIEFYEMPLKNREGKVFPNRYIVGHDPVDDDVSQTMSLTSTFVFDLLTDRIVAEYTGRLEYADDNFEIVRKLCLFYNARCMVENNKKGIFSYFKRNNCSVLLAETPEYLKELNIIKEIGYGNKAVGVNATASVNGFADRLTKDWLLKKVPMVLKENGEEIHVEVPNLFTIKNRAFLQEAAAYNPNANFDRIRAFGMVMIYREAFLILYQGDTSKAIDEDANRNAPENDDFFTLNYDSRF